MSRVSVLMLLLASTLAAEAQQFRVAEAHGNWFAPERFTFDGARGACTVRNDGRVQCGRWRFALPVEDGEIIRVTVAELPSALLIGYELTDGESGWGKLARVERGKRRPKWTSAVPLVDVQLPELVLDRGRVVAGERCFDAASGVAAPCTPRPPS